MFLPDACASFEVILGLIRERPLAVFLDYDGTLTPIVRRPQLAFLDKKMRMEIENLLQYCKLTVVSGRGLEDVRERVGVRDIGYAGSHGFDIEDRDGTRFEATDREAVWTLLNQAASHIRALLLNVDGVQIEQKRFSLAVHYRSVASGEIAQVRHVVEQVLGGIPGLEMSSGKMVFDIRPAIDWHKGRAVEWFLARLGASRLGADAGEVFALYFGDDTTDEDAFRVLGERGIGIYVGDDKESSAADYQLRDPEAVCRFLQMLNSALRGTQKSAEDPRFFGV